MKDEELVKLRNEFLIKVGIGILVVIIIMALISDVKISILNQI